RRSRKDPTEPLVLLEIWTLTVYSFAVQFWVCPVDVARLSLPWLIPGFIGLTLLWRKGWQLIARRMKLGKVLPMFILIYALAASAEAEEKSRYHLFNPVPQEKLRELSTDRPDKTESPFSVDAGRFQVETDLISFFTEAKRTTFLLNNMNAKVGITSSIDLQMIFETFKIQNLDENDSKSTRRGIGDTTLRVKYNLVGNDEGEFGFGLMPFVKLPTASRDLGNRKFEGGLALPFSQELGLNFDLGWMIQWNYQKNEQSSEYHNRYASMAALSREIGIKDLSMYLEFFNQFSEGPGSSWLVTADGGFTYLFSPNLQFDIGANIGITAPADDLNLFSGVSFRL
ncbi:MAG: transporter, partial [Bdellovibrionota bacterium]